MTTRTTTLAAAQDAIVAAIRAHFGDRVAQVGLHDPMDEFTGEPDSDLQTPALLLSMPDGFDPRALIDAGDAGLVPDPWGRLALRCYFQIACILSTETADLPRELPSFAAAVAGLVLRSADDPLADLWRGNTWGLGAAADAPEAVDARPGGFLAGAHGWDSWTVSWEQTIYTDGGLP